MNINGTQTPPADLNTLSSMSFGPSMASAITPQAQSVLGTTQGLLADGIRNMLYDPPPRLNFLPWNNGQQQMMRMFQQMVEMLMRMMMQLIGNRPPTRQPFPGNPPSFGQPPMNSLQPIGNNPGYITPPSISPGLPAIGYQPPPYMPRPVNDLTPWFPGQQAMIGMVRSMLEMVMRMFRDLLRRPPQPPSIELFGPVSGGAKFDINSLVGMNVDQAQAAAARGGVREIRVNKPGVPQTMDYRPDRLNLAVDASGTVTSTRWG